MHVLFASAEFAPLAQVGGLGIATAGLVHALRELGVDVTVVLPDYGAGVLAGEQVADLDVPAWAAPARVRIGDSAAAGRVALVTVPGIDRPHPYAQADGQGWADNDRRFFAFSAAVAALATELSIDLLHLNDWHTAAALAHLHPAPPTVFTVHTLGYQGSADAGWLDVFPHHREAFFHGGATNPVAGAVRTADRVIAVSPTYAKEIVTPWGGFGLDAVLRAKGRHLIGIRNGIDTAVWDPSSDRELVATYRVDDLASKPANRTAIRDELGLGHTRGPLIVMVTRLVDQKGIDLALATVPYLARLPAQLAILGAGDRHLVESLARAADTHVEVAFRVGHDDRVAHQMFAGGDLLLMPSRFEPCGLAQMQAMRYGTLPIVTDVGGLHDTVIDIDSDPRHGTGVVASRPLELDVVDALHRAVRAWSNPPRRDAMRRRGMSIDWSWRAPAAAHLALYRELLHA